MAAGRPLDANELASLLTPAKPPIERTIAAWFTLDQVWADEGCANKDCRDPRPTTDTGRNIVAKVNGQLICRYCFLEGYPPNASI